MTEPENTGEMQAMSERTETGQFSKGHSGNQNGKPKGARNKGALLALDYSATLENVRIHILLGILAWGVLLVILLDRLGKFGHILLLVPQ